MYMFIMIVTLEYELPFLKVSSPLYNRSHVFIWRGIVFFNFLDCRSKRGRCRHIVLLGSSYNRYAYMYLYKHQRKKTGVAQTNVRQKILIYIKM